MKSFSQDARQSDPREGVSTPIKNRNHIFHEDSLLSSSGSKRDSAFQLYCKQNLSPISYFPFITPIHQTPDRKHIQTSSVSQQKYKSFFSPVIVDSSIAHTNYQQVSPILYNKEVASESFEEPQKAVIDEKHGPKKSLNSKILPLVQINGGDLEKKKSLENEQLHYGSSSPVFRVSFDRKSQFDKFFDSDIKRDLNDDFAFQSDNPSKEAAKPDVESYKRVIQFHDENEQNQGGFAQDPVDFKSTEASLGDIQLKEKDQLNCKEQKSSLQKTNALLEEAAAATTQIPQGQKSLVLKLKKDRVSHSNATTAKKDSEIIPSDIALVNIKQKRKLFESPISSQNDFQTPSTQKKSAQQRSSADVDSNNKNSAGNEVPTAPNPPAPFSSSTKKELTDPSKNQEVNSFQSQESQVPDDDEQEEDEEIDKDEEMNSSKPQPFNASACMAHHSEEKKICCNCKRTKCLKLYCECFAASRVCEGCTCQGCFNRPEFEDMRQEARNAILGRNTSAFDPKIEQQNNLKQLCNEVRDVDSELKAHSKGCNCKKSNCLKKYCECYQLGVKCTKLCKCDHCKNTSSSAAGACDEEHQELYANAEQKSAVKNSSSLNGPLADYSQYYYPPDQYYQYYYPGYPAGYPYYGEYYEYPGGQLPDGSVAYPQHPVAHQTKKKTIKKKNTNGHNSQNKSIEEQKSKIVEENSNKEIEDPNKADENSEDDQPSIAIPPPLQKKIKSSEQTIQQESQIEKNVQESVAKGEKEEQNQRIEEENEIQKDNSKNCLEETSKQSKILDEKETLISELTQGIVEKKDESFQKNTSANKSSSHYGSPQAIAPKYTLTTRSSLRSSDGKNLKTLDVQVTQKSEDGKNNEETKQSLSGKKSTKSEIKEIIHISSKRNAQKKTK